MDTDRLVEQYTAERITGNASSTSALFSKLILERGEEQKCGGKHKRLFPDGTKVNYTL